MKKIRCKECNKILALQNEDGKITILCKGKKPNGERCNTENVVDTSKKSKYDDNFNK